MRIDQATRLDVARRKQERVAEYVSSSYEELADILLIKGNSSETPHHSEGLQFQLGMYHSDQ